MIVKPEPGVTVLRFSCTY